MNASEGKLVEVYVAADEIEARHVEYLLSEADIECSIVGAGLIGGTGELPPGWSLSPRIWVKLAQLDAARKLIDQWEADRRKQRSMRGKDWKCPSCLAQNPIEFDICWQCQFQR